jgi:photosystem II stability/assembly factor-like uncharacterized protein
MKQDISHLCRRLINLENQANARLLFLPLLFAGVLLHAQQWQQVADIPGRQTTALFTIGDTLFAAGLNKIYFTYDGGHTWDSTSYLSPTLDYISAVCYKHGRLYAGTVVEGIFSSNDGGQNWQADNTGLTGLGATNISSLVIRGDSLYAGTYGAGVFVKKISVNSNWSAYNQSMPWGNIESLINIEGKLFAGAGGNATVTTQVYPGHTWVETPFAIFNGSFNAFLGAARQGNTLLAAGTLGLYRSDNDGATWAPYNPGTGVLGSARFVVNGVRVIANLAKPAATSFLRFTDNQGLDWPNFEPQAPNTFGYDIALFGGKLYAARDNGLWRIALTTNVDEPETQLPELGPNSPNPFSDITRIPVTLPRQSWVEVSIFDAAGTYIRTVWRGEKPAGMHQFEVQAAGLPSGLYVCRLTTGTGAAARLITIQK